MNALVVFESMFGNNKTIAEAIAEGLAAQLHVSVVEVGTAPKLIGNDVRLLVAGGPTHRLGMTRSGTRKDAAEMTGRSVISAGIGLREWLADLKVANPRPQAAAFGTRLVKPRLLRLLPGGARGVDKRLRGLGLQVIAHYEHFFVAGLEGPLLSGERERALQWGMALAATFVAHPANSVHRP
jgi:hypothetical protein